MKKLPKRDPEAAYLRASTAQRRVGKGAHCACGEARPHALIPGSVPKICAKCQRLKKGYTVMDKHHPFGEANDPKTTIPIPVNDHRAVLNEAQNDWPKRILENPDGSPVLAAAGCLLGVIDTVKYLIETGLTWVAEMLAKLDEWASSKFGQKYWVGTPLEAFGPGK
jgi:hypothetical protein